MFKENSVLWVIDGGNLNWMGDYEGNRFVTELW
jgi:hypothetical protein